jgi:hypothetical protein
MANGTAALDRNFSCKRGRFSADLWLEKGGEGDGDEEKMYFWFSGPTPMGMGEEVSLEVIMMENDNHF